MLSSLITTLFCKALIFQGEISYWSLSGFERLTDKRWLAVGIYPLATNTEVKIIVLVKEIIEHKNDGFELIYYCQRL